MRPGVKTSEFAVALLNLFGCIIAAAQGYIANGTATRLGAAGALAYIVSRGLAKYEPRGPAGGGQ